MTIITNPVPLKKIIVVTAPSGAGKTTLRNHALKTIPDLEFAISGTNRPRRDNEVHGKDYWFFSTEEFKQKEANNEFIETEEVFPGKFYGTLFSEITRITENNHHSILLDIDVKGAVNVKQKYPEAKIIFIKPPSLEVLKQRLIDRKDTDLVDMETRLARAPMELSFGEEMCGKQVFGVSLINDNLDKAKRAIESLLRCYLGQPVAAAKAYA